MTNTNNKNTGKKLSWFLCWAVVFADIGTSLYYVPGILFGDVQNLAGLFVILTSIVFVLLVIKYIDITDKYPEGGGVVTVATHAFGEWVGLLGGMFIIVDYFLTASISSVSGFAYLNSVIPLGEYVLWGAVIGLLILGFLNIVGIKESASVSAFVAIAALIVDVVLVVAVSTQIGPEGWNIVFSSIKEVSNLSSVQILTGFAGAFLAFSGLESISQLSPAMALPRRKIATIAMVFVVLAIFLTSPLLTLFSTNLLTAKIPSGKETILESVSQIHEREALLAEMDLQIKDPTITEEKRTELKNEYLKLEIEVEEGKVYSERFMSELGAQYGGKALKLAVVLTASILLLFASNTAIIGAYHVFIALSRGKFLPKFFEIHNRSFDTPHWAIALAVIPPILIIIATQGDVTLLGQLYAFGLLGAFVLSSTGMDVIKYRENNKISVSFLLGIITSVSVLVAWLTNLYFKELATLFGGSITLLGLLLAYIFRKYLQTPSEKIRFEVELEKDIPQGQILIPVYDEFDPKLFEFASRYGKALDRSLVIMYIREFRDILQSVEEKIEEDDEALHFLNLSKKALDKLNIKYRFIYKTSNDTADTINKMRKTIKPEYTILTPYKRSALVEFLRGEIIENIFRFPDGNVLIYSGQ